MPSVRHVVPPIVVLVALLADAGAAAASAASTRVSTVKAWFLQGEQMIAVSRPGTTRSDAIMQLLAGPTAAETKRGNRTYVPAGTPLRGVSVAGRGGAHRGCGHRDRRSTTRASTATC